MIRNSDRKTVIHCNLNGIYMAAAYNPGAIVVFHAPKACSHIAHNVYWSMRESQLLDGRSVPKALENNLFVTGLSDKEAIFGGEKLLKKCLLEVIEAQKPEYVLVVSGCAAGVIGDDIESVAREVEQLTKTPIIAVPGAGFMNKQTVEAMLLTSKLLTERFVFQNMEENNVARVPDAKLMAIFGISQVLTNERVLGEIKRLFSYFGFTDILYPPCGVTKTELQALAKVSLVAGASIIPANHLEYLKFIQEFAQRLEIPALAMNLPVSYEETLAYLSSIGSCLGKEKIAAEAMKLETERYEAGIAEHRPKFQGKKYIFALSLPSRYFKPLATIKILADCGLELSGIVFLDELTSRDRAVYQELFAANKINCKIFTDEKDLAVRQNSVDFVITTQAKEYLHNQFCVKYRRIGVGGIIKFLEEFEVFVSEQRRVCYER